MHLAPFIIISPSTLSPLRCLRKTDDSRCCPPLLSEAPPNSDAFCSGKCVRHGIILSLYHFVMGVCQSSRMHVGNSLSSPHPSSPPPSPSTSTSSSSRMQNGCQDDKVCVCSWSGLVMDPTPDKSCQLRSSWVEAVHMACRDSLK